MKAPWKSKTLGVNLLAIAGLVAQAKYGYVVSPEAQAAGLAVVNLVLRVVTGQPIDWSKVKVSGLPCLLGLLLCTLLAAPLLSGCSLLTAAKERPILTELAVRSAVGRLLDDRPAWAAPTRQIAAEAIRLLTTDDQVSLAALESYVLQQIPWQQLSAEETELLRVVLGAVREEAEVYLQSQGVTDPGAVAVRAAAVLGWIHQAADWRAGGSAQGNSQAGQRLSGGSL